MRPSAGNAVTPDPLVWAVLPPERRAAAVALLAMLAARAAAAWREAVAMSLARYRLQGQPQQKIRPEHLDRAAVVYVRQSSRQQVLTIASRRGCSTGWQSGRSRWAGPRPR